MSTVVYYAFALDTTLGLSKFHNIIMQCFTCRLMNGTRNNGLLETFVFITNTYPISVVHESSQSAIISCRNVMAAIIGTIHVSYEALIIIIIQGNPSH